MLCAVTVETPPAPPLRRNSAYVLLTTGRFAQAIGAGVGTFAIPLLAFEVTGSVGQAGLISGLGQVGALLATLPAGVVADRVNRRALLLVAAATGTALWATVVAAGLAGGLSAWHLAAVLFGSSAVSAFVNPASGGALRAVVPAAQMPNAMAVNQGRMAAVALFAGPVGGFLYGMAHVLPFVGSVVGHAVELVAVAFVRRPLNEVRTEPTHPLDDLREGLRFVGRVPLFRAVLVLITLLNLTSIALVVAINLELVRTGTDPRLIGLVDACAGISMLAGAIVAGPIVRHTRVGRFGVLTVGVLAGALAVMALAPTYWVFVAMLALGVFLYPALNAGFTGYLTVIVPDRMMGRATSLLGLTGLVAAPAAPVLGSALLEGWGIGATLWVMVGAMVVLLVALALTRPLMRIGTPDTWAADALAQGTGAQASGSAARSRGPTARRIW
ncbi:putative arabinose efflux permease, MFS family [Promicromonospora thailandica]|uniref:Arabinose efflux permease, MFS family n=1 Tax=Promicromonospora thailandica TaxID=765201 RepID=A0A9X2G0T3_9MICO|nr:putative arabinose efflux permease, MFS family [Promicromonospora thailandica]